MSARRASPAASGSGRDIPADRSVPCSMRFTGRPRPIPGGDSTRCMTSSAAGTCCGARGRWSREQRRTGHRQDHPGRSRGVGIDRSSASWLPSWRKAAIVRCLRAGSIFPSRECGMSSGLFDSSGPEPDRAGGGEDRARAGLRGRHADCSFGFRPRRSAHDALQVLMMSAGGAAGGWSDGYRQLLFGDSA